MQDQLSESVGKVVREERCRRGLTQVELAFRVEVDPMTISRIERGKCLPSLAVFQLIAHALGYSGSELFRKIESFQGSEK